MTGHQVERVLNLFKVISFECVVFLDSARNCTLLLVLFLGSPRCIILYKLASVCTVVLVVYNNIPVSDFTHSYLKRYLKIIIWKCYLMSVFECAVRVSVSGCVYVSLPATVWWCIPFLFV